MPTSQDMVIFMLMTTTMTHAQACGVIIIILYTLSVCDGHLYACMPQMLWSTNSNAVSSGFLIAALLNHLDQHNSEIHVHDDTTL